jgi:hypothetical protein
VIKFWCPLSVHFSVQSGPLVCSKRAGFLFRLLSLAVFAADAAQLPQCARHLAGRAKTFKFSLNQFDLLAGGPPPGFSRAMRQVNPGGFQVGFEFGNSLLCLFGNHCFLLLHS